VDRYAQGLAAAALASAANGRGAEEVEADGDAHVLIRRADAVRRIKADDSLPFIPVIMQTALDSTERMVAGFEAGADDYVTKPINFAELEARVKSLLRIKALQEALRDASIRDGITAPEGERSRWMPSFAGALTDEQITALVTYLRTLAPEAPPWRNVSEQVAKARSSS